MNLKANKNFFKESFPSLVWSAYYIQDIIIYLFQQFQLLLIDISTQFNAYNIYN